MLSIQDFAALDLRVAKIISVDNHPNADRLLVLKIDLGEETRQIVAGIKKSYTPETLIGKQIIVIINLEPAEIRGIVSNGMLLAAKDDSTLSIIKPEVQMALGSKVG